MLVKGPGQCWSRVPATYIDEIKPHSIQQSSIFPQGTHNLAAASVTPVGLLGAAGSNRGRGRSAI
jgi:hypothetical protein